MNDLTGKKLLVLGGASQCLKVVKAAKEMGVYVIVADMNPNAVATKFADEVLNCSVLDTERIIRYCIDNRVDGVLNHNVDNAQNTHQAVCETLGFPCYGPKNAYDYLTDKRLFKQAVAECGMDIIPTYTVNDKDSIEYPVLVKPAEAAGAMGMTICYDADHLDEAIVKAEKISRNGKCFLEKFMEGCQDFFVVYYTVNGVSHLIRIGDRYVGKIEDGLNRQCICGSAPSKYTNFYLEKYDEKMKNLIKKVGVTNGPTFFQGFIDGDIIRWYDPGIRFPGTEYEIYYKALTGVDLIQANIGYALTGQNVVEVEKISGSFGLNGYHAVQLLVDVREGKIAKINGFEAIKQLPEVAVVLSRYTVGDCIKRTGDVKQRLAEIVITMQGTVNDVIQTVKKIQSMICVEDESGANMLISQMDADLLGK